MNTLSRKSAEPANHSVASVVNDAKSLLESSATNGSRQGKEFSNESNARLGLFQTQSAWSGHPRARRLARILAKQVLPNNPDGFTFCPRRSCLILSHSRIDDRLYVVAIKDYEQKFRRVPTENKLVAWVERAIPALKHLGRFVGGCQEREFFVMDVAVIIRRLDRAISFARRNKQRSIYHLATGEVVPIK